MYPVVPSHPTEHSEWYSKDHTPVGEKKSQSDAIVEQKAQLYKSTYLFKYINFILSWRNKTRVITTTNIYKGTCIV
jgi:hypothetical protein